MKIQLMYLCMLAIVVGTGIAEVQTSSPGQSSSKTPVRGVLLLAHGGRVQQWNEEVRHVADRADLVMPTEIAFGMATQSSIQAAVNRLMARQVTEIVAVPLFVSSHSSVIDCTSYLLGIRPDMPPDLKIFASMNHGGGDMQHHSMPHEQAQEEEATKPITASVPIRMTPALDHHPIVASILNDRAASISKNPGDEIVVLVAHGPVPEDENRRWLDDMNMLATTMRQRTPYAGIECLTLRDDAGKQERNEATEQLRTTVERISKGHHTALIVPLLLSYGGIEDGLRERLSNLPYKMAPQGLLPDNRIADWVLESARR
jgi:sirohydrochlorin ferrochelatase